MDSIIAINSFKTLIDYKKDGTLMSLFVVAKTTRGQVYSDYTQCSFSYHAGYGQIELCIDWNLNNASMKALGLHPKYNTNFQKMRLDTDVLYISADEVEIALSKGEPLCRD